MAVLILFAAIALVQLAPFAERFGLFRLISHPISGSTD